MAHKANTRWIWTRALVKNIFADFKRHDLGTNFYERNYDGTLQTMFLTRPLWGFSKTFFPCYYAVACRRSGRSRSLFRPLRFLIAGPTEFLSVPNCAACQPLFRQLKRRFVCAQ